MQPAVASDSGYYTRLGLEFDPFAAGAMSDFFFVGAQRRFFVQRAVHALYFSGTVVLLLGADGAGKSHALIEIQKELKDLTDICRIDATVLMGAAEIRTLLADALGLSFAVAAGNPELVHALERVRPAEGDPQPVLIAIDAAQLLSVETLAECAALVAGSGGRLRLVLAGEADLAIAWQQAQAGVTEILELKPLDRDETEDYVRTKLLAAGSREEHALSAAEFDQLFARSGGNFAAINALVPQLLQAASATAAPVAQRIKTLPLVHVGAMATLLAVVILLVLYRSGGSSTASKEAQLSSSVEAQAQPTSGEKTSDEQRAVALQLPESIAPVAATPPAIPALKPPPAADKNPSPEKPAPEKQFAEKQSAEKQSAEKQSAEKQAPEKQTPEKQTIAEKKETPAPKAVVDKPATTEPAEKPVHEKVTATNQTSSSLRADESALLALPSSNYVLQLMGAESQASVDTFARGAGKGLQLYCYRTRLRGKAWLIVVTGPYADRNAAQAALTKLPETVRKQQPWPRPLTTVQADIRAHSGR